MDALTFILGFCISETCRTGICPDNPEVGYVWQPYGSGYLYAVHKNTVQPVRLSEGFQIGGTTNMKIVVDAACKKVKP